MSAAPKRQGYTDDERAWQEHYQDYCIDNFGGREVFGREHDEASAYADQMMEGEDD